MYELILLNKEGKRFSKKFDSDFLMRKFMQKVRKSKELKILSYWKN